LVNFIFTLVALRIVDPFGRRRTMLYTLPVLVGSLAACAGFFHRTSYRFIPRLISGLTEMTGGVLVDGTSYPKTWTTLVLLSMIVYVAGFATGLGNIPWQQGELFRLEVRGLGTSICTAVNWYEGICVYH
jgi:SP family myo-inositol transporter-like MFS transporter 13